MLDRVGCELVQRQADVFDGLWLQDQVRPFEGETLPAHDGSQERKTRAEKAQEIPQSSSVYRQDETQIQPPAASAAALPDAKSVSRFVAPARIEAKRRSLSMVVQIGRAHV